MAGKKFSIANRIKSFGPAMRGIFFLLRNEHNSYIHLAVLAVIVILGFTVGLCQSEWLAVIVVSGGVLAAEAFNTAIEKLADVVSPAYNDKIKTVKDISAGAVLLASITAAAVGLLIFIPKFF